MIRINMKNNKKGLTLLECVLAMAIIAILAVCMVSGFNMTANLDMKATGRTKSDQALEGEIASKAIGEKSDHELTLNGTKIPIQSQLHEDTKTGGEFTVFEFNPEKGLAG
jgi:prepilin-type N-terminal cleavage/methylation domain-containing protein